MSEILHEALAHSFSRDLLRHCAWFVLLCTIFTPLEYFFAARPRQTSRRAIFGDIGYYFISGFAPHWLLILPLSLVASVSYHLVPWRVHAAAAALPIWLSAMLAFVIADLGFYWGHRLAHRVPFLWRFHAVHHAPKDVYFLISARAHPVDNAVIRLCGLTPIYLLGLGAPESAKGALVATLTMIALNIWGFFIHANVRWRYGLFESVVATPAFHHWHHTNSGLRDRNFASMLPIWDRLFGTWHLPQEWTPSYGVDDILPDSIVGQLLYPLGLDSSADAPRSDAPQSP